MTRREGITFPSLLGGDGASGVGLPRPSDLDAPQVAGLSGGTFRANARKGKDMKRNQTIAIRLSIILYFFIHISIWFFLFRIFFLILLSVFFYFFILLQPSLYKKNQHPIRAHA